MSDLTTLVNNYVAAINKVGTNCDELLTPSKVKETFELETTVKKSFGEADRDAGSGQVAVINKTGACQDSLNELVDTLPPMKTALQALPTNASIQAYIVELTNYENQMKYAKDALVLAVMAGAAETDAAFDVVNNPGSVIGMCIHQPVTSATATCWGYTTSTDTFNGYNMTPAVWNALPPAQQVLKPANLSSSVIGSDPVVDYFRRWQCIGLDQLSPVVEAGRKAALCQKVVPGEAMASASDPTFKLGDMTIYVYNSTRTTAQAANRHLTNAANTFQGASFYSYNVNTGALSGMALSAAAISALVLSYF